MSEELLKQDRLAKPKKITISIFVGVMAIVMIGAFASMHWILSDYFHFKATETEVRAQLDSARERCISEEQDAKRRIAEAEEKSKAAEDLAIARAETVEKSASERALAAEEQGKKRIAEAEDQARKRIEVLNLEYAEKQKTKEQEFDASSQKLKNDYEKQKSDLDVLLKGYEDRFTLTTNELAEKISVEQSRLAALKHQISLLPDLSAQCIAASNELVRARADRDEAFAQERNAQQRYKEWQSKSEKAKGDVDQWMARKTAIEKEIVDLASKTNSAITKMTGLDAAITGLESQLVQKRSELERVNSELKAARTNVASINEEIKGLEVRQKKSKDDCAVAVKDRDQALDEKRVAESGRDKAIAERQQAEQNRDAAGKAYEKRKAEVDGLIRGLDEVLKLKTKQVQSAAQEQAAPNATTNGGNN